MKILLTGATGFAGRAFLESLPSSTFVTILGRTEPTLLKENWSFISTDLGNEASVRSAANQVKGSFDALVHLAAQVPKVGSEDIITDAVQFNVYATALLLEVFGNRVQRHILGSTVEVYDQSKISGLITSATPVGPVSYYASTKLGAEYIALSFAKKNSLSTTILRFSVMYGPGDPIARAIPNFAKQAIAHENITVSNGQTLRDYIHVEDVAVSINRALSSRNTGVIPVGSGRGISIEEVAQDITKAAHSKGTVTSDDKKSTDIVIDTDEAETLLGFMASKHFPDGIEDVIDSYREQ